MCMRGRNVDRRVRVIDAVVCIVEQAIRRRYGIIRDGHSVSWADREADRQAWDMRWYE